MSHAIGISFGLEYITVSKARKDDTVDHIGCYAPSPAYQEFFRLVLGGRVQSHLDVRPREVMPDTHLIPPKSYDVENLLRGELEKVLATVKNTLGSAEVVPAISFPYHWSEAVQRTVFKAAEGAKIPLAGMHVFSKLPRALEKAYEFPSDPSKDDYFCIIVDYNRTYLHLVLCETDIVEAQVQLSHLGETSASQRGYREEVVESIEKFLSLTTVKNNSSVDGRILYHEIKAVILSGDASPEGMQEMRNILQHVFGQDLLCDSHPPLYAAAIGAARAAKRQVEDPKSIMNAVSAPEYIPEEPKPSW